MVTYILLGVLVSGFIASLFIIYKTLQKSIKTESRVEDLVQLGKIHEEQIIHLTDHGKPTTLDSLREGTF